MKRDLAKILSYTYAAGDCLEWSRCFNTDGYPRAMFDGNSNGKVHRVVWELANSLSAKGLVIRHTCDNPKCINPAHLLSGSVAENVRDMDLRGRRGRAKLSHQEVREIRQLWLTGIYKQKEIADIYGVDARTISSLVNRKHFKYVR